MRIASHLKSNLIAYLALFAALGGSAYATGKIGSSQIKPNAVKSKHVKDGSLTEREFAKGVLTRGSAEPGPAGAAGPQGPQGERGPVGPAGPTFGESVEDTTTRLVGCNESLVTTMPVSVSTPSRILAIANGNFDFDPGEQGGNLRWGGIHVSLYDSSGNLVAWGPNGSVAQATIVRGDSFPTTAQGVMINRDEQPFVAQPGEQYEMRMAARMSRGTCTGVYELENAALTQVLLGTEG